MRGNEEQIRETGSRKASQEGSFVQLDGSQLDHLVPVEERQDGGLEQDEEPEAFEEFAPSISAQQSKEEVHCVRRDCEKIERAARREQSWSKEGADRLSQRLNTIIEKQSPRQIDYERREELVKRLDAVVRSGLLQFKGMRVEHYGSYTSQLFTPTGDLDIAIEGVLTPTEDKYQQERQTLQDCSGKDVFDLRKEEKASILRAVCNKLQKRNISAGRIERILHARVPIIKFTDRVTSIPCDMAVGSGGARFKSTVLHHLSLIDPRFSQLVRLVKLWAQAFHMNDASNGTFNTFALNLMVIFHLQTRLPPILPPICDLFDLPAETVEGRPLHRGKRADMSLLEGSEKRARAWPKQGNQESILELFSSFFAMFTTAIGLWMDSKNARSVRCCTWAGRWAFKPWPRNHIVPIEDPFDATDNCARSVFKTNVGYTKDSFFQGLLALRDLRTAEAADHAARALFTVRPPPAMQHPYRNGARWQDGWGRRSEGEAPPPAGNGFATRGRTGQPRGPENHRAGGGQQPAAQPPQRSSWSQVQPMAPPPGFQEGTAAAAAATPIGQRQPGKSPAETLRHAHNGIHGFHGPPPPGYGHPSWMPIQPSGWPQGPFPGLSHQFGGPGFPQPFQPLPPPTPGFNEMHGSLQGLHLMQQYQPPPQELDSHRQHGADSKNVDILQKLFSDAAAKHAQKGTSLTAL